MVSLDFLINDQYNALWAMNERAQERCRRVTCTCHVGWKLPLEIPQSSTLKLESPYSIQDPKKRWSVQWRTCTDTPIALSKPHTYHIGLCSRSKFEHNQFSRSQYIEVGCARAHVHSDTLWACRSHITNWSLPTCQISAQSVQPFPRYISGVRGVHVRTCNSYTPTDVWKPHN